MTADMKLPEPEWLGTDKDEPEGSRYCQISETLWRLIESELAEARRENEKLRKVKDVCDWLFEREEDGYLLKHIKVEGEGDKWHIPEVIGLALADALQSAEEQQT